VPHAFRLEHPNESCPSVGSHAVFLLRLELPTAIEFGRTAPKRSGSDAVKGDPRCGGRRSVEAEPGSAAGEERKSEWAKLSPASAHVTRGAATSLERYPEDQHVLQGPLPSVAWRL